MTSSSWILSVDVWERHTVVGEKNTKWRGGIELCFELLWVSRCFGPLGLPHNQAPQMGSFYVVLCSYSAENWSPSCQQVGSFCEGGSAAYLPPTSADFLALCVGRISLKSVFIFPQGSPACAGVCVPMHTCIHPSISTCLSDFRVQMSLLDKDAIILNNCLGPSS